MTEILFATWDGGGNVPPALGIAAELASRGHGIRVMGHAGHADQVAAAGLELTAYPTARAFSSTRSNSPFALVAMWADRRLGQDVLDELERRPADVVVVDCLLFGAMDAVSRAGVTYVVLEHLFDEFFTRWRKGPLGLGVRIKGLDTQRLLDGAALRLVASTPLLDPAHRREQPANLDYSGPVVHGTPAAPDRPTVLVSLSTYRYAGQEKALQHVLDACAELPVRVIATTGPVIDATRLTVPGNAEVHRWLPHENVMPHVSLVVGHGGHSTTMVALAHDLPLLVLPMHPLVDQPMVGRAVQDAGAGRRLRKGSSAATIRPVVEELLADGPHRAAAARIGADIRASRGAMTAADRILSLAGPPRNAGEPDPALPRPRAT